MAALVDEDHVIEVVDRFEAENEWRVAMAFEDDRGGQRRLQAMHRVMRNDPAKAAKRRAPGGRLGVVGQPVQELLNERRRPQPADERCSRLVNSPGIDRPQLRQ